MEFLEAARQVQKTMEIKSDETLYNRWIIGGYDKDKSFQEFKNSLIQITQESKREPDEILSWLFEELG